MSANGCLNIDCSFKSTQLVISDSLAGHCQVPRHVAKISEWKSSDVDSNLSSVNLEHAGHPLWASVSYLTKFLESVISKISSDSKNMYIP